MHEPRQSILQVKPLLAGPCGRKENKKKRYLKQQEPFIETNSLFMHYGSEVNDP
jgi:hypothetical protein